MALSAKDLQNLPRTTKTLDKKGFTITEVVVAALIVAILSAGIFSAFWGTQYFLNRARYRIQAYNFAVEALDMLRSNYQYTSSAMAEGDDHDQTEICPPVGVLPGGILKGELANLPEARLKYDVHELAANGYKQVEIKIHWKYDATF